MFYGVFLRARHEQRGAALIRGGGGGDYVFRPTRWTFEKFSKRFDKLTIVEDINCSAMCLLKRFYNKLSVCFQFHTKKTIIYIIDLSTLSFKLMSVMLVNTRFNIKLFKTIYTLYDV